MIKDLWAKIKKQEKDSKTQYRPKGEYCERCRKKPEHFRRHERRSRKLRVIAGQTVLYVLVWLLRWKCSECEQTFTEYPDFIARHKRYAVHQMQDLGKKYVTTMDTTYEETVREEGKAISHVGEGDELIDHFLAGSTVWRWLGYWGNQEELLSEALDMIAKKCPESMALREMQPVQPNKYRSERRRIALETFLRMFSASVEFLKLFGQKIFPGFAIREGGL